MATTKPVIRIVLADDHETVRQGLRALLASVSGFDVVDDVGDTASAVASVQRLTPDVLILDLSMPIDGGLATVRQLTEAGSKTAVVVLTRFSDPTYVNEAVAAGASGYILKQSPFAEVERAVSHAARGEIYLDPRLGVTPQSSSDDQSRPMSKREAEVLRRAAVGQSNKDIAGALNISVKTVEVHKSQGMRKLGLRDRSALIRYATLHGWLREV